MELIPSLPDEIGLECLARTSYTTHRVASRVCRRWRETVLSREFYSQRRKQGKTTKVACLLYCTPDGNSAHYGVAVFDPVSLIWGKLSLPQYPNGFPLLCQFLSMEGKLVLIGGWDPVSYDLVRVVFVYDFTTRMWKRGQDMPSKRGCVYDVKEDHWTESHQMSDDEVWGVKGCRIDRCASACNGSWAELDGRVRFGACAVELGELTLVTGSAYRGATQGFFLVDMKKVDKKLEPVDSPQGFSGFVQSGCCAEI